MMPGLAKGDDSRIGTKANACHGRLLAGTRHENSYAVYHWHFPYASLVKDVLITTKTQLFREQILYHFVLLPYYLITNMTRGV